ncbi:DNA-directed RNA polymerase II second largest su bunit [Iridovirus CN01]|uniref:DNA-directed RNA polymerase subunit beta n=1 Tax=Shrimp hemocyte iridescent virus TaxID=2039780 RepID=A0A291B0Q7_9VIRU|nr:DNA-directed RNA polymerase II second largest subunit [Shrimp hemocyte iridescent virus]UPA43397.1 DNA-directed RNA polymerase II second largest su bunit [Iridovirus CN01]ATE87078.1 DNA-directed RNA polymerase II second largest subunit [Shrimp hemocyte iridescent virus]UPA43473.1 DNA-directed RNA polymerase II second largest su bunit [Iridovirus CN01]UPA43668.1 DNA-directed RNA polymerase II second largest su bunit [Iridovirus CN01]UPA43830.1 DNA-directed RNA polymerase II second largest su
MNLNRKLQKNTYPFGDMYFLLKYLKWAYYRKYNKINTMEAKSGSTLIKEYYEKTNFVNHQIDSYNDFVSRGIQTIAQRENPIMAGKFKIEINNIYVDKPIFTKKVKEGEADESEDVGMNDCTEITDDAQPISEGQKISYQICPLYPNDARKRNMNYDGTIYVSFKVTNTQTDKSVEHNQISIGKLPIMLRSNLCRLSEGNKTDHEECANDFGGYFIIKGKERVLVAQVMRANNKPFVTQIEEKEKYDYLCEVRSTNEIGGSILIQLKILKRTHELFFSLPYIKIKAMLPAGLVFKAIGTSQEDMLKMCRVTVRDVNDTLIRQYNMVDTVEGAIEYIANNINDTNKNKDYVIDILTKELFFHLGALTPEKSAAYLGFMIKKIVDTAYLYRAVDDKDNLSNKRVDGTSSLLTFLFQIVFKQFIKTIVNQIESKKNPDPITIIKNVKNITHVLNQAFMTGNWNTQRSTLFTREGVSQVLSMQNYGAKISHLRRMAIPSNKNGKILSARKLHASQFSFICPYETPEGEKVGLVTNLALSATISTHTCPIAVTEVVKTFKGFQDDYFGKNLVFVNGNIIGSCMHMMKFVKEFNEYRLSDLIDNSVSIIKISDENEIHIQTDEGRLLRPLFALGPRNEILYKQDPGKSWDEYVKTGKIVFRDVWELEQSIVAMSKDDLKKNRCDYLEICPAATMMSVMASVIPLSNHSQSPRNAYQSSMGKQAVGVPSIAYQERFDTTLQVLNTPQQPITKSNMVNVLKFNEMCHGANPVVAIMTFSGFNQEDSIILNKGSLDRGLFMSTTYKTITEEERKKGTSESENICLPPVQYRNKNHNYSFLNKHGIVWQKSTYLKKGTVIIGKVTKKKIKGTNEYTVTDSSVVIKHGEEGYLDKVFITLNEGIRIIKIRIRVPRIPEIGDKFASSTAQKGTCGMIYAQEDMPFDKDGISPDLIINPHAIPSRMTINMLIEMCFNLIGCKLGKRMDATPFEHRNIEQELLDWAEKAGIETYLSTMKDGRTGEVFPSKIFMAPCFYQRLKHMVGDKIHSRITGPLDSMTHQPVAGRAKDGGLRIGEMEKDCILSHGSTRLLKECMFDKSDKYFVPVCNLCGEISNKRDFCVNCQEDSVEMKVMPYATKLLVQELMGMGMNLIFK